MTSFVIKCTRGNQLDNFSFLHFRESKVLQEFKKELEALISCCLSGALSIEPAYATLCIQLVPVTCTVTQWT